MLRQGLLAFLATAALAGQARAQASPEQLTALAQVVVELNAPLSEIWPGYWPDGQSFILHAPETGAVFAGAASLEEPRFRPGRLPGAEAAYVIDYPSGVPNTILLNVRGSDDDLSTLFHEQFHDFQSGAFRWTGQVAGEFVDLSLIDDLTRFTAEVELERRVLAAAMEAPDAESRRELARGYLALRRDRESRLNPAIAAVERHREWSEGTAEYAGRMGSAIIRVQDAPVRHHVRCQLAEALRQDIFDNPQQFTTNMFRWRAYAVGASMTWLLDEQGADGWRDRVSAGTPLDVLLENLIGVADAATAAALHADHDIDGLTAVLTPHVEAATALPLDRETLLGSAPFRLIVEVDLPVTAVGEMRVSFHSARMTALLPGEMALPNARVTARWRDLEMLVEDRTVVLDMPAGMLRGRGLYRISLALSELPELEIDEAGRRVLLLDGLSLTAPADAEVLTQGEALVVRVVG